MISKRTVNIFAVLLLIMLSSCDAMNSPQVEKIGNDPQITGQDHGVSIEMLNPKVEISVQLEQLANEYMKENPDVRIHVRTIGGGSDDRNELRAMFAAGHGPDIFSNGGYSEARLYAAYLEDLSNQPWVQGAKAGTLAPITIDGKIYGMPFNIEGYGFIYNKDLFAMAGIEKLPKTLSDLSETAKKLQSAGIKPFANAYAEKWVLGVHLLNIAFAHQKDPDAFIQALYRGSQSIEGNRVFLDLLNLLDLTIEYGDDKPLTIDYNAQVMEFAQGKAAMIQQGNWIQPILDQIKPNMNVGILPIPINDDPDNDALAISIPNYWIVNKQSSSEKKEAAKRFLNWMVSSDTGKNYLSKLRFIPAFENFPTHDLGPLANDILTYMNNKKTLTWNWFKYPAGVQDEFGVAMQAYVGKQLSKAQLLQEFQKSWVKATKS
ncbi:extracellular solute-binding protein [Cohnella sp. CFH 77786]|uniref:ABC transporter substrate-binding protein n=1 Tax=Cohnella sp. CFH 77786 TaxID=2662265 RepID=UPI001C60EB20|nr:extracellular solute-binding protein [Cohnella sp. CFH 77786]MBW5446497.1 extracellular solute-binding protein [Cohnella sp. CFH 77786]